MLLERTKNVRTFSDEKGEKLLLHYNLLVDRIMSENRIGIETYGISISMFSESGAAQEESAEIHDISTDEKIVYDLMKHIMVNGVTPVSLPYIIEDFLSC